MKYVSTSASEAQAAAAYSTSAAHPDVLGKDDRHAVQYWLSSHISVCMTAKGAIVLDLRNGKYSGLSMIAAQMLAMTVQDWPTHIDARSNDGEIKAQTDKMMNQLLQNGLLSTVKPSSAPAFRPCKTQLAATRALSFDNNPVARPNTRDFLRFICANATTAWSLRFRSVEIIVSRVLARKAAHKQTPRDIDERALTRLVSIFRRLRCYTFSTEDRCLFHALALVNFLARYQVYPTWFIGVSTTPWCAHSWVQLHDIVLDGNPEQVLYYTPILMA